MQLSIRDLAILGATCISMPVVQTAHAADGTASPPGNVVHLKRLEESPESPAKHFLAQSDIDLKNDDAYVLTFWAKASPSLAMRVTTKNTRTWAGLESQRVDLGSEWQQCEVQLVGEKAEPGHTRLEFHYDGQEAGDIWIADVHLRLEGADKKENLIVNGRFEDQLNKWYSEGQQAGVFLIEVQTPSDANAAAESEKK